MAFGHSPVFVAFVFLFLKVAVEGVCRNKITSCRGYQSAYKICDSSTYKSWAKTNCALYCGFCTRTTTCKNKISGCDTLSKCSDSDTAWGVENCERYCGFCGNRKPVKISTVGKADQVTIINAINDVRANVQPAAKGMPKVRWDQALADLAQEHTDTCDNRPVFQKLTGDYCSDLKDDCDEYDAASACKAPNLAWAKKNCQKFCGFCQSYGSTRITMIVAGGQKDWSAVVKSWASQKTQFQYGKDPKSYLGNNWWKIGAYTQLVTSTVVRVGCAFTPCSEVYNAFYACNFITGQDTTRPYASGTRCASCPNSCRGGLCDCGGKFCLNGKLDVNSCTCK